MSSVQVEQEHLRGFVRSQLELFFASDRRSVAAAQFLAIDDTSPSATCTHA